MLSFSGERKFERIYYLDNPCLSSQQDESKKRYYFTNLLDVSILQDFYFQSLIPTFPLSNYHFSVCLIFLCSYLINSLPFLLRYLHKHFDLPWPTKRYCSNVEVWSHPRGLPKTSTGGWEQFGWGSAKPQVIYQGILTTFRVQLSKQLVC